MRHSHTLIYLASMSPSPACSIGSGAFFNTSVSPITASGHLLSTETFSPSRTTEEVEEAKPSMEGAVATIT